MGTAWLPRLVASFAHGHPNLVKTARTPHRVHPRGQHPDRGGYGDDGSTVDPHALRAGVGPAVPVMIILACLHPCGLSQHHPRPGPGRGEAPVDLEFGDGGGRGDQSRDEPRTDPGDREPLPQRRDRGRYQPAADRRADDGRRLRPRWTARVRSVRRSDGACSRPWPPRAMLVVAYATHRLGTPRRWRPERARSCCSRRRLRIATPEEIALIRSGSLGSGAPAVATREEGSTRDPPERKPEWGGRAPRPETT